MMKTAALPSDFPLLDEVRACTLCRDKLPLPPKPILQAHPDARILIAGQAPGRITHERGLPFDDASGDRLRQWLEVSREQFYDPRRFAVIPMGFCYPGTVEKQGRKQGDMPPRPECSATWHPRLFAALPNIELTLILGKYAMAWHLKGSPLAKASVGTAVAEADSLWPTKLVLPHPSPRNRLWFKQHPEFEQNLLPRLRQRVAELLAH
ncbi:MULTISPECIES: uracil-DNA glycosylase family protein [Shewanella]|uniref:uracil-DNA glycosylase family protein n=1 Tax=Shewanella TaxID=22 RepID=UPI0007878685|nr:MULTISPECIES: uracil-DNA glycosylase family protein [Shewanella]MBO2640916.1 uracil-DNA glycosylase family protein [Shewanella algae]NJI83151.1 uracil-DNA glycosylase family protein [Shewanella sp. Iso12]NKZ41150.1 uracil-DNA glycosylase family protein [Shewanella algae]QTE79593.1 uracil-DNA glycosylase family protein [Shewanella algae]